MKPALEDLEQCDGRWFVVTTVEPESIRVNKFRTRTMWLKQHTWLKKEHGGLVLVFDWGGRELVFQWRYVLDMEEWAEVPKGAGIVE